MSKENGATIGTWTRDLFITNEVLYHWAMAASLWDELGHYMIYYENSSFCDFYYIFFDFYESFSLECLYSFSFYEFRIYFPSICSESEHHLLNLYLFFWEWFFIFFFSEIISRKRTRIVPSFRVFITGWWEAESPWIGVIPIATIVHWLISWFCKIRELIMIPSYRIKIIYYLSKFTLEFWLRDRIWFPIFRIRLIF